MKIARKTFQTDFVRSYGAFLELRGKPVLIVGGGAVAARKAAGLLECGALVTMVAPRFDEALESLEKSSLRKQLTLVRRKYRIADLLRQRLVFAATDNPDLNTKICAAAEAKGIWSNCAAPPEAGSFSVPATVGRGRFALAISTGGASPALAAHWRKRLEKLIGPEWGELAELQYLLRGMAHERVKNAPARRALLEKIGAPAWAMKLKKHGAPAVLKAMKALLEACTAGVPPARILAGGTPAVHVKKRRGSPARQRLLRA